MILVLFFGIDKNEKVVSLENNEITIAETPWIL